MLLFCDLFIEKFKAGFPSGQRDQTVNLTRKLRWFESTSRHQICKDVTSVCAFSLSKGASYEPGSRLFSSGTG